jgi:hypothetical protein
MPPPFPTPTPSSKIPSSSSVKDLSPTSPFTLPPPLPPPSNPDLYDCLPLETLDPAPLNPPSSDPIYLRAPEDPDPDPPSESPRSSGLHVAPAEAIIPTALSTILQKMTGLFVNRLSEREMEGR